MAQQKIHKLSSLSHYAPTTHGYTKFALELNDNVVTSCTPVLGSMHRGVEKLFESRDYRQILSLANRHEWLASFAGELGVAQLIEEALGLEIPDAAIWFRTLLLEYTRVTSHLAFVAGFPFSDEDIAHNLRLNRELWISHIADYAGNRMHLMITRIGGVSHTPGAKWLTELAKLTDETNKLILNLQVKINSELSKYRNIGILENSEAIEYSVSGPVARSSAYAIDLRQNTLKYSELDFKSFTLSAGDTESRIQLLINEIMQSVKLLEQLIAICFSKIDSNVEVPLPKVLRIPEGVYEHQIETPLGIAQWLLISHNDKMPHRLKLRPASLHTLLATQKVLVGVYLENIDAVISSMPFLSGDTDR